MRTESEIKCTEWCSPIKRSFSFPIKLLFRNVPALDSRLIKFDKISWIIKPDLFKTKTQIYHHKLLEKADIWAARKSCIRKVFARGWIDKAWGILQKPLLNGKAVHFLRCWKFGHLSLGGTNNHVALSNKSQYEHFPGHFSKFMRKYPVDQKSGKTNIFTIPKGEITLHCIAISNWIVDRLC